MGPGALKLYASGEKPAKDMGLPLSTLEATYEAHCIKEGGFWSAYPSDKSWDEALRGMGGIVVHANGERLANELGRVNGEMWKSKPPLRQCLRKVASDEIIRHCKHCMGYGVMNFHASREVPAKDMDVPPPTPAATYEAHYDKDGGFLSAYPSDTSWDEANGKIGSGKKFCHYIISGSAVKTEQFYVATIMPVIQ